jgi:hypothetical protein
MFPFGFFGTKLIPTNFPFFEFRLDRLEEALFPPDRFGMLPPDEEARKEYGLGGALTSSPSPSNSPSSKTARLLFRLFRQRQSRHRIKPNPTMEPMTIPAIAPALSDDDLAGLPDALYILKEFMDQYVSANAVGLFMTNEMQFPGHPLEV